MLGACHESVSDRAEREASEYTRKYCPTPVQNFQRTDSLVYNRESNTYIYYCTFFDQLDDAAVVSKIRRQLDEGLKKGIRENTSLKVYKDADFNFLYVCRSAKNPSQVLYKEEISPKDYR